MKEMKTIRGKNPQGKAVTLQKSHPLQLSLFQMFLGDKNKYSNTIELYDAIPKYVVARQFNKMREHGTYLPILRREFHARNPSTGEQTKYRVNIKPARIEDKQGNVKEYYPTEREELVEEALRKIATDNLGGVYLDDRAGMQFTLYQLRKELGDHNHSIHLDSLIQALHICNESIIEVKTEDGTDVLKSPIFPVLLISNRKEWIQDPKNTRCYVQFNPLVTHSIDRLTYRQFDYLTFMDHKGQLTRWLHKRLSHNFIQASIRETYNILASTIIRDSGVLNAARLRDNIRAIDNTLEELRDKRIIMDWEKASRYEGRSRKIVEVKYTMRPSPGFIQEVKIANKRKTVITGLAEGKGTPAALASPRQVI